MTEQAKPMELLVHEWLAANGYDLTDANLLYAQAMREHAKVQVIAEMSNPKPVKPASDAKGAELAKGKK